MAKKVFQATHARKPLFPGGKYGRSGWPVERKLLVAKFELHHLECLIFENGFQLPAGSEVIAALRQSVFVEGGRSSAG